MNDFSANGRQSDFFCVVFPTFSAIALNASQQQSALMPADSEFEMMQIAFHMTIANAAFVYNTRPIPNMTALITDTGSGRQLMNSPVPLSALAGYGSSPFLLPVTRIFAPNSQIQMTLTNFDAAVATANIIITLLGRKIFQF